MFLEWSNKKIIAISNYKISKETELFSSQFDIIIRFNSGSNIVTLVNYDFHNYRTDLCVLSGWEYGYFGDLDGFINKKILFSRPKYSDDINYGFKKIAVRDTFIQKISYYTTKISYIPLEVFYSFYHKYQYNHPTTGLIVLFYFKKILSLDISGINFYCDDFLFNTFLNQKALYHNINIEKEIFKDLKINNYII